MNTFDNRKKAFETKFIQDSELKFKLTAKRNKLIGEWAADKLQQKTIEEYVKEVRESDLEKPGDDDILEKIIFDFSQNNLSITREELILKFKEFEDMAKEVLILETDN